MAHAADRSDVVPALASERLWLGVLEQPVRTVPAAQPGVTHATHRRVDAAPRRRVRLVDVDGPRMQPGSNLAAPTGAARPHTRVESVLRCVRARDRVFDVG